MVGKGYLNRSFSVWLNAAGGWARVLGLAVFFHLFYTSAESEPHLSLP